LLFFYHNFIIICENKNNKLDDVILISVSNWHSFLGEISHKMDVYVPVGNSIHVEYGLFSNNDRTIHYNKPAPVSPLKIFLLPVKENALKSNHHTQKMIVGIPSCDLKGLDLLDEIYLDEKYPDPLYKRNRENTILIGTDCHDIREHCHCTTYGVEPYPTVNADATLISLNGQLIIAAKSPKGDTIISLLRKEFPVEEPGKKIMAEAETRRSLIRERLRIQNQSLPDYVSTGKLISKSGEEIWNRHAATCVSCGACATICPTCTCFLLIDRPDFDKVRQMDACQYPGFEKIAAGEDPLHKRYVRFRNRYLCKYVWKPEKFSAQACTGCGRCIECCIGNIDKNKIFIEMLESK
jgi:sulfhydrogenase subunit beta (sulfur reductase)